AESKIKRVQRELYRKQKGSANRAKARRALAREYEKVANRRADFAHKFSTSVVKENSAIACETLNLIGIHGFDVRSPPELENTLNSYSGNSASRPLLILFNSGSALCSI